MMMIREMNLAAWTLPLPFRIVVVRGGEACGFSRAGRRGGEASGAWLLHPTGCSQVHGRKGKEGKFFDSPKWDIIYEGGGCILFRFLNFDPRLTSVEYPAAAEAGTGTGTTIPADGGTSCCCCSSPFAESPSPSSAADTVSCWMTEPDPEAAASLRVASSTARFLVMGMRGGGDGSVGGGAVAVGVGAGVVAAAVVAAGWDGVGGSPLGYGRGGGGT